MCKILVEYNHPKFSRSREEIKVNKGLLIGLWLVGLRQPTMAIVPHRNATEREKEEGGR